MSVRTKSIDELISALYDAGTQHLADYPWEFESDRWAEFVCCALVVGHGLPPAAVKESVHSLVRLKLLSVKGLATSSAKERTFIAHVFNKHGCEMPVAVQICSTIVAIARAVQDKWDGHLQRLLRAHGEKMSSDLQTMLSATGIGEKESKKIAVLWLQNVANIPILLPEDPHVEQFCHDHGIAHAALVDAADRLDLNVAVLDDLMALEAQAAAVLEPTKRVKRRPTRENRANGAKERR
jgi:hypothetical protein